MYADQFQIYHGNANPDLARKICRYLGMEPGPVNVFQFANENIFVQILDNVREKDVFIVQPTLEPREPVDHGAADHDRRLQAGVGRADHRRDPVLRLRAVGQEGPAARADHGTARRRHDLASPAPTGS